MIELDGRRLLTVTEAADRLGVTTAAIYMNPARYQAEKVGERRLVPLERVEELERELEERPHSWAARATRAERRELAAVEKAGRKLAAELTGLEEAGREPIEIRGVEGVEGVGRVEVTRYLCLPCRLFFRSPATFETHACRR